MKILLYVLMILAAGGMLFGNKKYKAKGVAWGRPLAGACGVLSLVFAIWLIAMQLTGNRGRVEGIIANENKYYSAKLQFLADYLADKHGDKEYLVIMNPPTEYNAERDQLLKDALRSLNVTEWYVLEPEMPVGMLTGDIPEEAMMDPMMEEQLTPERFNKILHEFPDVDAVISTIGLPMEYQGLLVFSQKPYQEFKDKHGKEPPALVLLDAYIYELKNSINGKQILAAVTYNPGADYRPDENVPKDYKEAFEKRYLLITPENVSEMATTHESLFAAE